MASIGSLVVSVQGDSSGFGKEMKKAKAEVSEFAKLAGTAMKADFLLKGIGQALRFAEKMPDISAGLAGWANQMTGSSWFDPEKITMGFKAITGGQAAVKEYNAERQRSAQIEKERLALLAAQNEKLEIQKGAAAAFSSQLMALDKALRQEGMNDVEKAVDDAKRANIDNPHELKAIEDMAKRVQKMKEMKEINDEIRKQEEEAVKFREQQLEMWKNEDAAKAQEKLNAEFEETQRLLEGLLTPADRFAAEVERINEQFQAGNFDQATFEALIGKAGEGLPGAVKQAQVRGAGALARGSAGDISAVNAFRDQGRLAKPVDDPQKKLVAEAIKAAKDRERANKLLADIAAKLDDPAIDPDLAVVEF